MAGVNETLEIIIKARDDASENVGRLRGNLEKLEPAFKKMAAVGTVAFAAIAGIGVKALFDFAEAQKTMTIASQALSNTIKSMSDEAFEKLEEQLGMGNITTLQGLEKVMGDVGKAAVKLGFDDEAASLGFAKLFQVTKSVEESQKKLKLAMDLSAFSGRSLEESVKAITMTYTGGGKVLKEFGIEVKEGSTALEALEEVQVKVGGSAEKVAATMAGQIEIMKIQFGNLSESIGASLAPVVTNLLAKIAPLIERFAEWAEKNPELLSKIVLLAGAIAGLVAVVGFLGLALPPVIFGFTLLLGPIGLVVAAIALALIPVIMLLMNHWDLLKEGAITAFENIGESILLWWEVIRLTFTNWGLQLQLLGMKIGKFWEGVKEAFSEGVNFLIGMAESYCNAWIKATNFVIGALNKIQVSVPEWVPGMGGKSWGINIATVPEISLPRFEFGGRVPGAEGTMVPIMAHGGERIVSARSSSSFDGSPTYNVTINNPVVRSREDVNMLREQIEEALRDVSRIHKLTTI